MRTALQLSCLQRGTEIAGPQVPFLQETYSCLFRSHSWSVLINVYKFPLGHSIISIQKAFNYYSIQGDANKVFRFSGLYHSLPTVLMRNVCVYSGAKNVHTLKTAQNLKLKIISHAQPAVQQWISSIITCMFTTILYKALPPVFGREAARGFCNRCDIDIFLAETCP